LEDQTIRYFFEKLDSQRPFMTRHVEPPDPRVAATGRARDDRRFGFAVG
jgi:hypothetical protein